eukprot:TRINITY_DN27914_c0_g1_i1.p1 TRINITY_DN27914_c0_g1~~TRINITY_DN27914_c0_g1_i1.p1  ORF type:complete len:979 (-),score=138.16 TRINITY_DN27914_c0_g1_i1:17-2953(-)
MRLSSRVAQNSFQSSERPTPLIDDLLAHSKANREAKRAQRRFIRHVQVAILTASWTVLLSLPVIIWPLGEDLFDQGCRKLDLSECVATMGKCHPTGWPSACVPTKPSAYLSMWGTLMLQFVFSMSTTLGETAKRTLLGIFGMMIALVNTALLNNILFFLLGGGAFADPLPAQSDITVNSRWLPLCNDGYTVLSDPSAFCALNTWWAKVSLMGSIKLCIVWVDLIFVVVLCLSFGFHLNTRTFALSTHVYFMMTFVNPKKDGFSTEPSIALSYCIIMIGASIMAILSFLVPHRRFTAMESAKALEKEATEAVCLLVGCMPGTASKLIHKKATGALSETEEVLDELQRELDLAVYEAWDPARIHDMKQRADCLRECIVHMTSVHHAAGLISDSDRDVLQSTDSLQAACSKLCDMVTEARHSRHEAGQDVSAVFPDMMALHPKLSPEARGFVCAISGVMGDVTAALEKVSGESERSAATRSLRRVLWDDLGLNLLDRSMSHPRFIIRNTLSICFSFWIGWLGIFNVMPSYSFRPSSTVAVIVYTYTGASVPITVKRMSGIVLGKVAGMIIQLTLAVKTWYHAMGFTFFMWLLIVILIFLSFHADKELRYVCVLAAGNAAGAMIPADGKFRDQTAVTVHEIGEGFFQLVAETVIGVVILTVVDLMLAARATQHAELRLDHILRRTKQLLWDAFGSDGGASNSDACNKLSEELSALRDLIPYASQEPRLWQQPFKTELYETLERHIRCITSHALTVSWVLSFGDLLPWAHQLEMLQMHLSQSVAVVFQLFQHAARSCDTSQNDAARAHLRETLQSSLYLAKALKPALDKLESSLRQDQASSVQVLSESSASVFANETSRRSLGVAQGSGATSALQLEPQPLQESQRLRLPFLSRARSFFRRAQHDYMDDLGTPLAAPGPENCQMTPENLEDLYQELRTVATNTKHQTPLPLHRESTWRAELLSLATRAVHTELQEMQLALLEH